MDVLAALLPSAVVGGVFVYAVVRVVRAEGRLRGARHEGNEDGPAGGEAQDDRNQ